MIFHTWVTEETLFDGGKARVFGHCPQTETELAGAVGWNYIPSTTAAQFYFIAEFMSRANGWGREIRTQSSAHGPDRGGAPDGLQAANCFSREPSIRRNAAPFIKIVHPGRTRRLLFSCGALWMAAATFHAHRSSRRPGSTSRS